MIPGAHDRTTATAIPKTGQAPPPCQTEQQQQQHTTALPPPSSRQHRLQGGSGVGGGGGDVEGFSDGALLEALVLVIFPSDTIPALLFPVTIDY